MHIKFILGIFLFIVFGCTGHKNTESNSDGIAFFEKTSCPADFIRGTGTGETEQNALALARAEISSQIQLSITVSNEYIKKNLLSENKEILNTRYNSQITQTTELLNAQDVKLQAMEKSKNKVFTVACMSIENAAKPYLSQLPQINDSLNLAIQTVLSQSHPLAKKEAARAAENLRMRQIMTVQILHGLGKNVELKINESYSKMVKDYEEFSSNYKIIWEGDGEQISQTLLSKISSRYKIETGDCAVGIKLVPITNVFCEYSQFGPQCSYLPNMEGRSCADELYFTLKGQMVRGTGKNEQNEAMRKLLAIIPSAAFWNNWFEELDKYSK